MHPEFLMSWRGGGANPSAIYNLHLIVKVVLNIKLFTTAFIYVQMYFLVP
jgi:hypothetical protein